MIGAVTGPMIRAGAIAFAIGLVFSGCSSAPKKPVHLSELKGKKVALVDIDGDPIARSVVEVSLVNQLVKRGTFTLVPKSDVQAARTAAEQDLADWRGIARRAGADVALRARVLDFKADEKSGYVLRKVEDSQLAAERGESARMAEREVPIRSMDGLVRVELEFTELAKPDAEPRKAEAKATDHVEADAHETAIHLPAKMSFLEKLSNRAFEAFFEEFK